MYIRIFIFCSLQLLEKKGACQATPQLSLSLPPISKRGEIWIWLLKFSHLGLICITKNTEHQPSLCFGTLYRYGRMLLSYWASLPNLVSACRTIWLCHSLLTNTDSKQSQRNKIIIIKMYIYFDLKRPRSTGRSSRKRNKHGDRKCSDRFAWHAHVGWHCSFLCIIPLYF